MAISTPRFTKHQQFWIRLGSVALLIRILFVWRPDWCEQWYARGLYPWIRQVFDHTLGYLPFPSIYLLVAGLLFWLGKVVWRSIRRWQAKRAGQTLPPFSFWKSALTGIMGLLFWFLILWGYNYARQPVAQQLDLEVPEYLDYDAIWAEAQYIKAKTIQARAAIPQQDTHALTQMHYPDDLETTMRRSLKKVLARYGYDTSTQVRGRFLPAGTLLGFNSSGVYMPFTGEGHVDGGIHTISQPFTMAHELAHGYGFGDEAVCNFWGYLACLETDHPAIQYSGYLMYWRYVYGALMEFMTEEAYQAERATISKGMYYDLEAIYAVLDVYPPFIPFLQPMVYDVYLKVQGIEEGIQSYDRMVMLVASWRKQYDA